MGTTYLSDAITGINLARHAEVVVFLVSRNSTFPYDERVNEAPQYPCDLFRFNSLPIFGKTDDETGIQVEDEEQLGVKLALRMSDCASWDEFQSKAIRGKGVTFAVKSRSQQSLQERQADARARTYGLFVIAKDTFMRIKRKVRFTGEKPVRSDASLRREQVAQVLAMYDAFFDMQRLMNGGPTAGDSAADRILADKRKRLEGLVAATKLEGVTEYQNGAGAMIALPMLSRAFGDGHGSMFGRDFRALTMSLGLRGADVGLCNGTSVPESAASFDGLTRYLELLWETQRLYFGMRYLNALAKPSITSGQRPNRVDVIETSRQTIETAFLEELAQLDGEEAVTRQYKDIRLQLTRARAMLDKLEEQYGQSLVKARAATKAAEPPQMVVRDVQVVYVEALGGSTQSGVAAEAVAEVTEVAVTEVADQDMPKPKRGRKPKAKTAEVTEQPTAQPVAKTEALASVAEPEVPGAAAQSEGEADLEIPSRDGIAKTTEDAQSQPEGEGKRDVEALKKKYGLATDVDVPF
jgi:hypothetical protein